MKLLPAYLARRAVLLQVLLAAFFVAGCVATGPIEAGHGETIRVLVLAGERSLEVRGSDRGLLVIRKDGSSVTLNGRAARLPVKLGASAEFMSINGRQYRGAVIVHDSASGLMVINELSIEAYLVGIINHEISSKWHEEAVKAQAVIARTYALYQKDKRAGAPYDLEGTVMGQVYKGASAEDEASRNAVRATYGEVLAYNGAVALAAYHSNAGGMTEASSEVWVKDYPYLKSVESPYDEVSPRYLWELTISAAETGRLLRAAGHDIGDPVSIMPDTMTASGRMRYVMIVDSGMKRLRITGEDLRKAVGYSVIRSTIFEVEETLGAFVFRGRGSGHGVGLSQWGAKGMAENGYSYRDILLHYYPGTAIERAY